MNTGEGKLQVTLRAGEELGATLQGLIQGHLLILYFLLRLLNATCIVYVLLFISLYFFLFYYHYY